MEYNGQLLNFYKAQVVSCRRCAKIAEKENNDALRDYYNKEADNYLEFINYKESK
jgi:hypothetical protein